MREQKNNQHSNTQKKKKKTQETDFRAKKSSHPSKVDADDDNPCVRGE